MDLRRRRGLTRFGAPAAFLVAVTIAVLLIKSALSGSSHAPTTVALTSAPTHARQATTSVGTSTASGRYYTVQSGDTLGGIALREKTTVDELLRLNPGIDPQALHAGQRIRVG